MLILMIGNQYGCQRQVPPVIRVVLAWDMSFNASVRVVGVKSPGTVSVAAPNAVLLLTVIQKVVQEHKDKRGARRGSTRHMKSSGCWTHFSEEYSQPFSANPPTSPISRNKVRIAFV